MRYEYEAKSDEYEAKSDGIAFFVGQDWENIGDVVNLTRSLPPIDVPSKPAFRRARLVKTYVE